MNKNNSIWGTIVVKSNLFVRFLEEMLAWKNHFNFVWPLEATLYLDEDRRKSLEQLCVNLLSWLDLNSKKIFLTFFIFETWWILGISFKIVVYPEKLCAWTKTGHHHATATFEFQNWADDKQSKAWNSDSKYRQMALVGFDT